MPSTKEIRRRIKSVKSTRQITKAMELVAAAKMRRAQQQALSTRTYASLAWELVKNLSDKTDPRIHRLLRRPKEAKNVGIVLITSNRGLIGGFNNNIINTALNVAKGETHVEFVTLGKKGLSAVRKRSFTIAAEFEKKDAVFLELDIRPLSKLLTQDFVSGKYDKIVLVYMDFVSTLQQKPRVNELLPLSRQASLGIAEAMDEEENQKVKYEEPLDYLFEPSPDQVLEVLLPRLVEMQIYQAVLETNAAEHSARMVAMKNASDAASDLVDEFTLEYNQIRQAAITKEISEIVSGQLALTK